MGSITLGIVLVVSITIAMVLSSVIVMKIFMSDKFLEKLFNKSMKFATTIVDMEEDDY